MGAEEWAGASRRRAAQESFSRRARRAWLWGVCGTCLLLLASLGGRSGGSGPEQGPAVRRRLQQQGGGDDGGPPMLLPLGTTRTQRGPPRPPRPGGDPLTDSATAMGPTAMVPTSMDQLPNFVNTTLPPPGQLLWAEEFEGTALNGSRWNIEEGDGSAYNIPGWGNDELEVYDRGAVALRDGQLILTAQPTGRVRADGNQTYTSGKVSTARKVAFYPSARTPRGIRVQTSVYLPQGGKGIWPSVWMLPEPAEGAKCYGCGVYGPWPTSGEINMMEAIDHMGTTFGWAHYGGPPVNIPDVSMLGGASLNASEARVFHTYAVDWTWQNMTFSTDNHSFARAHCSRNLTDGGWYTTNPANHTRATTCAPFDQPFYIVIQLAVGGGWPGYPNKNTVFPQYMAVDYVRVYEL